jgi:5-methylcytosine-specific restriction endonuclease McrA
MPKNPLGLPDFGKDVFSGSKKPKKKANLTHIDRIFVWEHPEMYGRTCNICGKKITKISDLQFDHTKPKSKGGTKLALAHSLCNRVKGSKSLVHVQAKLKLKTTKPKTKTKKAKPKKKKPMGILDLPKSKFPNLL